MDTDRPEFTIHLASLRDLNTLVHLEKVCFGQQSWTLLDLAGVLTMTGLVRVKAVLNDEMIGFSAGDPRPRQGVGWVTTIGVLPEHRRKGVATALLDAVEEWMDVPRVKLCVRRSNWEAQHMYEKRGYQQMGVWRSYYANGEDALVFEKRLPTLM